MVSARAYVLYTKRGHILLGVRAAHMEIKTDEYSVSIEGHNIYFSGVMRLRDDTSAQITSMVRGVLNSGTSAITVHLFDLEFLNSQGRNTLAKLVIEARNQPAVQLVVRGNSSIAWQARALPNLKRIYPGLMLRLE